MQGHRAVDDPLRVDQGDPVDAGLGQAGPELADPGLGISLRREPLAGVLGGDGDLGAVGVLEPPPPGASVAVGCRKVGGWSGRFTAVRTPARRARQRAAG